MWQVVIPMKAASSAKSRLALPADLRRATAEAMAFDTVRAVRACRRVSTVTVLVDPGVLDDPSLLKERGWAADRGLGSQDDAVTVIEQPPPSRLNTSPLNTSPLYASSLNRALSWFLSAHRDRSGPVAVIVADLPSLTPHSLDHVLTAADAEPVGFVPDRAGTGTTVLTAGRGVDLRPLFGASSAAAHTALGATLLHAELDVRSDVDTIADLEAAALLGLGPHTSRIWESISVELANDDANSVS